MWGSALAVCITHNSLTYQFEHSGKVRSGLIGHFFIFIAITFGLISSVLR